MLGFAGSSLDGKGEVRLPDCNGEGVWKVVILDRRILGLLAGWQPLAVSGFDGKVRLFRPLR